MTNRRRPGEVRDAILGFLQKTRGGEATVSDIHRAVEEKLGTKIASSSVRSYLRLNADLTFLRTGRGKYRLRTS